MIDLDRLDDQLESALAENLRAPERPVPAARRRPSRPAVTRVDSDRHADRVLDRALDEPVLALDVAGNAPGTSSADQGRGIAALLRAGRLAEADLLVAAHAATTEDRAGPLDRRDAAAWATMRGLLDGRPDDARATSAAVLRLGREGSDSQAWSRHLAQRFWLVIEWGGEDAHHELLEQCREQAYTHGDVVWRGALTLLLARLGRAEEARRELDATLVDIDPLPHDATWIDIVTNLAEAAATLADSDRARILEHLLARVPEQLVLSEPAWVCKGSLARYRAGLAAATGARAQADAFYRTAVDAHRAAGARPLLARTLHQWGTLLAGHDDLFSRRCLREGSELADQLGLVDHATPRGPLVSTSA